MREAVSFSCVSMSSSSFLLFPPDICQTSAGKRTAHKGGVQKVVLPEAASNRAAFSPQGWEPLPEAVSMGDGPQQKPFLEEHN